MKLLLTFLIAASLEGQILSRILFAPPSGPASIPVITGQTLSTLRNNFSGCVGFTFSVGAAPITVTALGRWVFSGNSATHVLHLINTGGSGDLATSTLNTAGQPVGAYAYAALAVPQTLSASTQYEVDSEEVASGDQWSDSLSVTTTSAISSPNAAFHSLVSGGCVGGALVGSPPNAYVPVNFLYHL